VLTVVDGTLDDGILVESITVEDGSVGVVTVTVIDEDVTPQPGELTEALYWK